MKHLRQWLCLALCVAAFSSVRAAESPAPREWTIDGVVRQALVYVPPRATKEASPVIFAFHGHGGNMNQAARSFGYQSLWPEAIVVYMQGLNTPGRLTDPDGKRPGWQKDVGDQNDRDLKFFDAVLKSLKQDYKVDEKRIYATGHSNGGAFTYLLWAVRGDLFAAVAPCAAATMSGQLEKFKPKPVFHLAGKNDPLVKFEWQERLIDALRKLNQCGEGQTWEKQCTLYPSKLGAPVVAYIHPGRHEVPTGAPAVIVKFFREQKKPDTT
jgi:polyhydroxybutyrate depolymerase